MDRDWTAIGQAGPRLDKKPGPEGSQRYFIAIYHRDPEGFLGRATSVSLERNQRYVKRPVFHTRQSPVRLAHGALGASAVDLEK